MKQEYLFSVLFSFFFQKKRPDTSEYDENEEEKEEENIDWNAVNRRVVIWNRQSTFSSLTFEISSNLCDHINVVFDDVDDYEKSDRIRIESEQIYGCGKDYWMSLIVLVYCRQEKPTTLENRIFRREF